MTFNLRKAVRTAQSAFPIVNVTLLQTALWPRPGRLIISDHYHQAWADSVKEPTDQTVGDVRAISVNDIFGKLGVDRIDLLKLDIQGSERELFSADSITWLDRVGFIVAELHDRLRAGCAKAFYSALVAKDFKQEIQGRKYLYRAALIVTVRWSAKEGMNS
jgi:FkbM family methyltransferase